MHGRYGAFSLNDEHDEQHARTIDRLIYGGLGFLAMGLALWFGVEVAATVVGGVLVLLGLYVSFR